VSDPDPRCSDAARQRQDPQVGTAAPARRWLLVEHPGPWARDALAGSGIDRTVRRELQSAASSAGARILLIRRPAGRSGRLGDGSPRAWAVLDHAPGVPASWGTWTRDDDLLAAAVALDPELAPAGTARPADEPVLLVCAHGRHDTCCAVRGRPIAAALAGSHPDATWECSHVGGDRFAANLVVLPDGAYYGYLDPDSAVAVVQRHLAAEVDARFLRGLSTEPPLVQAAVVAALQEWGPVGARTFSPVGIDSLDDGAWRVELAGRPPAPARVAVTIRRSTRPAARLTCQATADRTATVFEAIDRAVLGAPTGPDGGPAGTAG
jgi:(2Fe-2S) ferredoxin